MLSPAVRRLRLAFVLSVLAISCVGGFIDATDNMRAADGFLDKLTMTAQLTYVVFGAMAMLLILTKHRNVRWPLITWAVAATATAALATYVWSGAGLGPTLAAGAAAAALAALVTWAGIRAAGS